MNSKIIFGDCLVELKKMDDNSVDAIVTDPPYGISFMAKKWDYDVPSVEIWKECLRVLKAGGHILCACGTRTQHRMTVNIEDAGFEIRDVIAWVYGSGFPKSMNIGKAVDKLQGNEREVVGGKIRGDVQRAKETGSTFAVADANKNNKAIFGYGIEILTKGNSAWEGFGTALKPAMELWTLARKPLSEKTIAENVLKYGTGGINIDGCRIGTEILKEHKSGNIPNDRGEGGLKKGYVMSEREGRFPANFIHDGSDEVVSLFPYQKSGTRSSKHIIGNEDGEMFNHGIYGKYKAKSFDDVPRSEGSASRFFMKCPLDEEDKEFYKLIYQAKASKSERNNGLDDMEEEQVNDGRNILPDNAFQRGKTFRKNIHPTVKPIKLMSYLCKLITPEGGIVLDPFTGSGSTGIGAIKEGFNFVGIEKEEEYCKIAEARINHYKKIDSEDDE